MAVQDRLLDLFAQLAERRVATEAELIPERFEKACEVFGDLGRRPGRDRSAGQRLARIGDDQLRIHLHPVAETMAVGAGAERSVEGERPRLELIDRQRVIVGAGQLLGETSGAVGVVVGQVYEVEDDEAVGQAECGLDRFGEPLLRALLDHEAIDDDVDRVLLLLGQLGRLIGEQVLLAVDDGATEALGL